MVHHGDRWERPVAIWKGRIVCINYGIERRGERLEIYTRELDALCLAISPLTFSQCSQQSGFSPAQCGVILDWNRISLTFHQTGSDSVWAGPGFHCRVRFKLAGIGLIMINLPILIGNSYYTGHNRLFLRVRCLTVAKNRNFVGRLPGAIRNLDR